jgi:hypothetical protein
MCVPVQVDNVAAAAATTMQNARALTETNIASFKGSAEKYYAVRVRGTHCYALHP